MKGLQLKLKGEWVALPEDFSLTMEQTNPIFNEQGTFSFPFKVPLELNRSLFKNIADPFGDIRLEDIDGMESELWFNGILLYKGIVETDDEIEFEDSIPMIFLSGNSDLMKRIEGLKAQDIPLDREIKLGYVVTHAESSKMPDNMNKKIYLPDYMMMNYTNYNISNPYPTSPFCNVRVCTSDENGKYKVLDAKRPYSGVCFYVMYFLDCLFKSLKIQVNKKNLINAEDINRLAFFNTKCESYQSGEEKQIPLSEIRSSDFCGESFSLNFSKKQWAFPLNSDPDHPLFNVEITTGQFSYKGKEVYATNKNYPDVLAKDLIDDLWAAFGLKMFYDATKNECKYAFIKEILTDKEVITLNVEILSVTTTKNKSKGYSLSYGVTDNISFNYDDYSNVVQYNGYGEILKLGIDRFNNQCLIDKLTGRAYRIKVNKETGNDPALFEVGSFRDFTIGNKTDDTTQLKIGFNPVAVNDVSPSSDGSESAQTFAVFVDVELYADTNYDKYIYDAQDGGFWDKIKLKSILQENYNSESSEISPLRTYDAGYTLGIMRGPGSLSKLEYSDNYDNEGNSSWVQTAANYAFSSDTCDNYGRFFDYNGTGAGGVDQTDRFSLSLVSDKPGFPIDSRYANRGLVAKFLSEYLYFLENRKTIMIEVEMSITQLINIDFLKRHKIGSFVGYINKVSYNITVNGMGKVMIEMYIL